jgi:hypothetical protein
MIAGLFVGVHRNLGGEGERGKGKGERRKGIYGWNGDKLIGI